MIVFAFILSITVLGLGAALALAALVADLLAYFGGDS